MEPNNDIKVFISSKESICDECKNSLGRNAWITLNKDKGAFCLSCSDIDHLIFLPSGDTALTRRSRKHSTIVGVVLKFSKHRRRYERQGLLVDEQALKKAEKECLADEDARERARERDAIKRQESDQKYVKEFATQIKKHFPTCPKGIEIEIAKHACLKYSGRVGRSRGGKDFNEDAISLAVIAHIRHNETNYHELLAKGHERSCARSLVKKQISKILESWI